MQKFLRKKGKIDKRINNVSCTFAYFYVRILLFEIQYVVERRNRSNGRGKETEIERERSPASRWRGKERREASRFFYGRPDVEIRKGGEPRMRIVGAVWKRKSSGDRDDSLFEARSPDVPSFSGIPQDVHVCPTPVEGSASCRHRASERSAEIVRRRVSSRARRCYPCSRWAMKFGWMISRGKRKRDRGGNCRDR